MRFSYEPKSPTTNNKMSCTSSSDEGEDDDDDDEDDDQDEESKDSSSRGKQRYSLRRNRREQRPFQMSLGNVAYFSCAKYHCYSFHHLFYMNTNPYHKLLVITHCDKFVNFLQIKEEQMTEGLEMKDQVTIEQCQRLKKIIQILRQGKMFLPDLEK